MLFEPMNRAIASNEIESLWHVGQGSSPWSPDPNTTNFIRRSRKRETSSPAIIHVPNCKTTNRTTVDDTTVALESAGRWFSWFFFAFLVFVLFFFSIFYYFYEI
jgi:hypothetical protein